MISVPNIIFKFLSVLFFLITINNNTLFSQNSNQKNTEDIFINMETSLGLITIMLYDKTPLHKSNFLKLVDEGFYSGVKFHRVIKGFMAQAGDPNSKNNDFTGQLGQKSHGETIPAEFYPEYIHKKGALSAARTGDNINPEKKSSGSQFYLVQGKPYSKIQLNQMEQKINQQQENNIIGQFLKKTENNHYMEKIQYCQQNRLNDSLNILIQEIKSLVINEEHIKFSFSEKAIEAYTTVGGTPFLDNGYTVFGEVIKGLEIIDKICSVPTLAGDIPENPVTIISTKIIK
jgi:cyclophilin family peptidyl-prolyl cis-trans isomerase